MRTAVKLGCLIGALHFVFIVVIASEVFAHQPELWLYAAVLDLPVNMLSLPFINSVCALPHVSVLPGILGDWGNFLFPLIWFGLLGTVQWFIVGWLLGVILSWWA